MVLSREKLRNALQLLITLSSACLTVNIVTLKSNPIIGMFWVGEVFGSRVWDGEWLMEDREW